MVAKSFEVGDLVWAKMKGYSPWPGKIIDPPTDEKTKIKKSHHYVFFYGSNNHAWIPDEGIVLHNPRLVQLYSQKSKSSAFKNAIDMIVEISKDESKYQKPYESFENRLNEAVRIKYVKRESLNADASSKNVSKVKRKVPEKKLTFGKKKKRIPSSDHSGAENIRYSEPPRIPRDNYESLIANIPPNIDYNGDSVENAAMPSAPGLLSRDRYIERPSTPPIDLKSENNILKEKEILPTSKKIGFLGLGKVGQGIVKNLLQSGHFVTVWNRTTEKCEDFLAIGAEKALTPADVVTASDIIFCCMSDPDAAKALVFGNCGILSGLESCNGGNKGYIEMTSMEPKTSQAIAHEVEAKGGRYLEARLNGSRQQAIDGTLLILGAGDKSLFDECESCFQATAKHARFLSPEVGAASKVSVFQNMFLGSVYGALAEALSMVKHSGLDELQFLDILQYYALDGKAIPEKGKAMVLKDYASNTPLKHIQKDISIGLGLGSHHEQPLPVAASVNEIYKHLKFLRYADHDVSAIYEGTKR